MSLINDALKRATQQKKGPIPEGGPVLQPVTEKSNTGKKVIFLLLVVLVLGGGGYAGWTWWKGRSESAAAAPPSTNKTTVAKTDTAKNPIERAAATLETAAARGADPAPETKTTAATPATPPAADTTAKAAAPVTPVPAPYTELRVQGIFFRLKDPTAIINGKTVRPGDEIDGSKVVKIERTSVKVERDGQPKDLFLKQQ